LIQYTPAILILKFGSKTACRKQAVFELQNQGFAPAGRETLILKLISTSAQLNPRPKMLWCLLCGHHSILGLGFNCAEVLNEDEWTYMWPEPINSPHVFAKLCGFLLKAT